MFSLIQQYNQNLLTVYASHYARHGGREGWLIV